MGGALLLWAEEGYCHELDGGWVCVDLASQQHQALESQVVLKQASIHSVLDSRCLFFEYTVMEEKDCYNYITAAQIQSIRHIQVLKTYWEN